MSGGKQKPKPVVKAAARAGKPAPKAVGRPAPAKAPPPKAPPPKAVAPKAPVPAAKAPPPKVAVKAPAAPARPAPRAPPPPPPARAAPAAKAPPKGPPPKPRPPPKPVANSAHRGTVASGSTSRNADSAQLRIGDDLPSVTRGPIGRVDIARYCGASGTFNAISLDEPYAKLAGLPSVVAPGGLALGLASAAVGRWLREDGRLVRLGARVVKMIWPGDQLTARARVSELRPSGDQREVELDVWVENQKGELVLRGSAVCLVRAAVAIRPPEPFFAGPPTRVPPPPPRPAPAPTRPPPPPPKPGRR